MTRGLLYHQGGLGDFVLSLPAIFRTAAARRLDCWHFWGPPDRLALLPGFVSAPPELLRAGHTLWGTAPASEAARFLQRCERVLAFGGRAAPEWPARVAGKRALAIASFPATTAARVPVHQSRQLDALGIPRLDGPFLPAWRRTVLPFRSDDEIVVHPGSGDSRKNLPREAWRQILAELRDAMGVPVRVALGPVETEQGNVEEWRRSSFEVSRCGTLGELLAVLSRAKAFLGNDSGPTHLAGILGIPTVAVFAASNPVLWRPLGQAVRAVKSKASCAPCTDGAPFLCRSADCLEEICPQEVVQAALRVSGRDISFGAGEGDRT